MFLPVRWDMEKSRLKFPPAVLHVEVVPFFYGKCQDCCFGIILVSAKYQPH